MQPLVLGAGGENIFMIIVLVISIISWLINVVQGNSPDGNPRPRNPNGNPQRRPQARSEVENLLREVSGDKRPKAKQREPARPPKPPAGRPANKQSSALPRPVANRPPIPQRNVSTIAESKLPTTDVGSAMRTHHLGSRVESAVQHEIIEKVQHDLGNQRSTAAPVSQRSDHPLVKVLRDPAGIREAILLNEILQRPKCLRRT